MIADQSRWEDIELIMRTHSLFTTVNFAAWWNCLVFLRYWYVGTASRILLERHRSSKRVEFNHFLHPPFPNMPYASLLYALVVESTITHSLAQSPVPVFWLIHSIEPRSGFWYTQIMANVYGWSTCDSLGGLSSQHSEENMFPYSFLAITFM